MKKISVVIPAYNEEAGLAAALAAVLAQDYPDFEVIVVDNASTDKTSEVASRFPVRLLQEDKKGPQHARERGRIDAEGEVIVNMDADCLPDAGWLSRGAKHFADPAVSAVTGPYDYYDGGPAFRWMSLFAQRYAYRCANALAQLLGLGAVLIGGNCFIHASALEKAGGYDTSIAFYGDDTDTARRVSKHGRVVFDPKLVQKTSARRFKSEGSFKISILYLFHFFKVIYKGRRRKS